MTRPEIERLRDVYGIYDSDDAILARWDPSNIGNVLIKRERDEAIQHALFAIDAWPVTGLPILEVGCGSGGVMSDLHRWGASAGDVIGIDVVSDRLVRARAANPALRLAEADASSLPFAAASFHLVLLFTVMSSIVDPAIRSCIAAEIDRVLSPGGAVIWYDFRVSYPLNRNTVGISKASIRSLFPAYGDSLSLITVVPQVSRRLGPTARVVYPFLSRLPITRTHYIGTLRKQA